MPIRSYKSLLLILVLPLSVAAAGGVDQSSVECEWSLAKVALLPKGLQLNEAEARLAAGTPRHARLMMALTQIFSSNDPEFLVSVAGALIENPNYGRTGRALIARNEFFRDFPNERTEDAELNYLAIRERFQGRLDTYASGVLAALCPKFPRADRNQTLNDVRRAAESMDYSALRRLLALEVYRDAAVRLMERYGARGTVPRMAMYIIADGKVILGATENERELEAPTVISALKKKKLSPPQLIQVYLYMMTIVNHILHDLKTEAKDAHTIRREIRRRAPDVFTKELKITSGHEALITILLGAVFQDPTPMGAAELERQLIQSARRLVMPIRDGISAEPKPIAPVLKTWTLPTSWKSNTNAVPAPKSERVRVSAGAPMRASSPSASVNVEIDPELDLRAFIDPSRPRPWRELVARQPYQIVFATEPDKVQTIEFDHAALAFVREKPNEAKKMIRALGTGMTPIRQTGVQRSSYRSDRYAGVVFEIFMGGKYHPLMLLIDGTWQILRVEHTDTVERAARSLEPMR